jgi:oligosaccharyltransferase complex subunit epsilon
MARKDAHTQTNTKKGKNVSASSTGTASPAVTTGTTSGTITTGTAVTLFDEISNSLSTAVSRYQQDLTKSTRLRLIDTFLLFLILVGIVQFAFCILGGSYPFNAFLAGFSATVGQFVLTVALRLQSCSENGKLFEGLVPERAFGEYVFASLLMHFVLIHFIN